MSKTIKVLDHGYVTLRNIAGPTRRIFVYDGAGDPTNFDANDVDPANAARFSLDGADDPNRTREDDLKLADYLMKNRHTTPFEMVTIWLEMQMPLFVARQFVRHRTVSINEVSARYTKLPKLFYVPDTSIIGVQSKSNKQGRDITRSLSKRANRGFCDALRDSNENAYAQYEIAIDEGIPNEIARCFLPVNIYTKWLWKQDLHNMMHFLNLRLHPHAQYESRMYAHAIHALLKDHLPHSMELFDKYRRTV